MTPFSTIITHPGSAHKDEFIACALLLALRPATIFRREPTEADLTDPATLVVDVGHRHEPALNNFDHHQLPRDHAPTCSISLILQALDLYADAREFCDWLEPAEWGRADGVRPRFVDFGLSDGAEPLGVRASFVADSKANNWFELNSWRALHSSQPHGFTSTRLARFSLPKSVAAGPRS